MKTVFKIVLAGFFAAALLAAAPRAHADDVYWTTPKLLTSFFPQAKKVTYKKFALTQADRARIGKRLGYAPAKASYTFFVALDGAGKTIGYALIDDEVGQHLPITFAVKLDLTGTVQRHEIMTYRESHGSEVKDPRFRKQFVGKTSKDAIRANDDIVIVSGATISSRSMAVGVRRAVILIEELVLRPAVASGSKGKPQAQRAN